MLYARAFTALAIVATRLDFNSSHACHLYTTADNRIEKLRSISAQSYLAGARQLHVRLAFVEVHLPRYAYALSKEIAFERGGEVPPIPAPDDQAESPRCWVSRAQVYEDRRALDSCFGIESMQEFLLLVMERKRNDAMNRYDMVHVIGRMVAIDAVIVVEDPFVVVLAERFFVIFVVVLRSPIVVEVIVKATPALAR